MLEYNIGGNYMKAKNIIGLISLACVSSFIIYKGCNHFNPPKYSTRWFDTIPDKVLNAEREAVRKQYCMSGSTPSKADHLQNLLNYFDSVISKRAWNGETPRCPTYSREHGRSLYKAN